MNLNNKNSKIEFAQNILNSIPNEPKIPFSNYLLDLVGESDGKERSLYLNNVNHFIKDVWNEIVKSNQRKLNVRKLIPAKLGVFCSMIYSYKNGKKAISIQMLYRLLRLWRSSCNKGNEEVENVWDDIFHSNFTLSTHSKHQKTILPKYFTPKLSYLIGWIVGDGHLKEMHNYLVKISEKSTDQLRLILKPIFKELFDVETPIFQRYKGGYAIQIGSKPIYRFLKQVIKVRVGKIPKIVNRMDLINKKYFLLGVLDSEGWVSLKRPRIVISQADKEFLLKIIDLFKEFDIKCNGPTFHKTKLGEWNSIRIESKREFLKFYQLLGSCHIDKLRRMQNMVRKIG